MPKGNPYGNPKERSDPKKLQRGPTERGGWAYINAEELDRATGTRGTPGLVQYTCHGGRTGGRGRVIINIIYPNKTPEEALGSALGLPPADGRAKP